MAIIKARQLAWFAGVLAVGAVSVLLRLWLK